ncbi:MAG: hypothetical protein IIW70_01300 [Bacteroidales bacterium]|nr:hypothetical protein [Bacteroidales bacterium]
MCLGVSRDTQNEQRAAHIDIADLIIQWKRTGERLPGTSRKHQINERTDWSSPLNKWFPVEYHPEIQAPIEDLDLIPVIEERVM